MVTRLLWAEGRITGGITPNWYAGETVHRAGGLTDWLLEMEIGRWGLPESGESMPWERFHDKSVNDFGIVGSRSLNGFRGC
jgi:hypothetical protein